MSELQPTQVSCNTQINYSEVLGKRILPFLMELDLEKSILNPNPGENQRFIYKVTGSGEDTCQFADLSHLVLGICSQIPENQIVNITVTIDGVEENITLEEIEKIELCSPLNPDPSTEYQGLKLNFGLNKVNGKMAFGFELTIPYPVGPNPVYLFGNGVSAKGLTICGPVCGESQGCETIAYQQVRVCVPVTVTPYANQGDLTVSCYAEPIITPGIHKCKGHENGNCAFTITQNLCVSIPIEFGATASTGNPSIQCKRATFEDVYTTLDSNNEINRDTNNTVNFILKILSQITQAYFSYLIKRNYK